MIEIIHSLGYVAIGVAIVVIIEGVVKAAKWIYNGKRKNI